VRLDCNQIRAWRNNAGDDVTANVMVVVSHLDHHRDFKYGVSHDRADEAGQLARETSACKSALRELPESPVIAGSLREEQGCADVAYRLLVEVQKGG